MARRLLVSLALVLVSFFAAPATAQEQQTNPAGVWRMTYYHVKPGMMSDVLKDRREHFKVTIEFSKSKGRIKEYKIFTNPMTTSPEDWSYAIAIRFANWSMQDPNDAFTKEQGEFLDKHYGSREKREAAAAWLRDRQTVVRSVLVNEVELR
ncbi:MAG: hypothetical protein ACRD1B_11575 [Thermoanaerobaculia bacterium]